MSASFRYVGVALAASLLLIPLVACDETVTATPAPADASSAVDAPSTATAAPIADAALDSSDAGACHTLPNSNSVVRAKYFPTPFPEGTAQGGDFTSGNYVLTDVDYFSNSQAVKDAGVPDADAGAPLDIYWKGALDVTVSLGASIKRTWQVSYNGAFDDRPVRHETLLAESKSATQVLISIVCTDFPLAGLTEYTSNGDELRIFVGGDAKRIDTYKRQN